jgi:hypothetical protein
MGFRKNRFYPYCYRRAFVSELNCALFSGVTVHARDMNTRLNSLHVTVCVREVLKTSGFLLTIEMRPSCVNKTAVTRQLRVV